MSDNAGSTLLLDGERASFTPGESIFQVAERLVRERVDEQTWRAHRGRGDGQPAREVAAELGMKIAAVHKVKSRVLQMIREEIGMLLGDRESS